MSEAKNEMNEHTLFLRKNFLRQEIDYTYFTSLSITSMDVKITKLSESLVSIQYKHTKHKNISSDIKCKVYEAYTERCKSMSENTFCAYLKKFWLTRSSVKKHHCFRKERQSMRKTQYTPGRFLEKYSGRSIQNAIQGVLDHGQIVERGTHASLVERAWVYAKMLELQSGF